MRSLRARAHDERGATIILALVTIVVIATLASAMLSFQSSTLKGQQLIAEKRAVDLAADGVIDMWIDKIRNGPNDGAYLKAVGGAIDDPVIEGKPAPGTQACQGVEGLAINASDTTSELVFDPDDDGAGNNGPLPPLRVRCSPFRDSGTPPGFAGKPSSTVLMALGGVRGPGNRYNASDNYIPFCDDFATRSGRCEAGIMIGAGVNGSGVVVATNGGQSPGDPLVISNGSIIARNDDDGSAYQLNVMGTVKARRACLGVNVNWVSLSQPGTAPTKEMCPGGTARWTSTYGPPEVFTTHPGPGTTPLNPSGTGTQDVDSPNFFEDPMWHHEMWDPISASRNEWGLQDGATKFAERPAQQDWWTWDAGDANSASLSSGSPVSDVAKLCQDRFMKFTPGSYTQLEPLNYLMVYCPENTLFWFSPGSGPGPGVYYFDFEDIGKGGTNPKYWREPVDYSQIVAGTPFPTTSKYGWEPCSTSCPQQPVKTLYAGQYSTTNWTASDLDKNAATPDEDGTPNLGIDIDGRVAQIRLGAGANQNAMIKGSKLRTPLPEASSTTIQALKFAIRETHDSATVSCFNGQPDGPEPRNCSPWNTNLKEVVVRLKTKPDTAWCDIKVGRPNSPYYDEESNTEIFDIMNGCANAGGFDWGATWPSGAGWTADKINDLTWEYKAQRANHTQTFKPTPLAVLDGAEFQVTYTGVPAPPFPYGCDPEALGVQFIFGGWSRIQFRENDVHFELCASEGLYDEHAIGIYGLSGRRCCDADGNAAIEAKDAASSTDFTSTVPPPRIVKTSEKYFADAVDPTTIDIVNGKGLVQTKVVFSDKWTQTVGSETAATDPWEKLNDGSNAYTSTAFTGTTAADFDVQLPNDLIPEGATIERVEARVRFVRARMAAAETASKINTVKFKVTAGDTTADPYNYDMSPQSFSEVSIPLDDTITQPLLPFTKTPPSTPVADDENAAAAASYNGPMQEWIYGDTEDEASVITQSLTTPGAINGAKLELFVGGTTGDKRFILDGMELTVHYRPRTMMRPLRGCMTTRSKWGPNGTSDSWTSPGSWNRQYAGGAEIQNGRYSGSPAAWTGPNGDQAYGAGVTFDDKLNCALLYVGSESTQEGTKWHLAGDIYAPTAAVDFSGKDNDAAFATDGVVARQITVQRWKKGPETAAFGCAADNGCFAGRDPRHVVIQVAVAATGEVLAEAEVKFHDGEDGLDYGKKVEIVSWKRRP